MAFNPGGSGGLSSASDVALSNPSTSDSLLYDTSTAKWSNSASLNTAINSKINRAFVKRSIAENYVLTTADATDTILHTTAETPITITLPQNSAASIAQEIAIPWRQWGAGQITFIAGSGATVVSRGNALKSAGENAEGVVTKVEANVWLVTGDVVA